MGDHPRGALILGQQPARGKPNSCAVMQSEKAYLSPVRTRYIAHVNYRKVSRDPSEFSPVTPLPLSHVFGSWLK